MRRPPLHRKTTEKGTHMANIFHRTLGFLLAAVMLASLCACGSPAETEMTEAPAETAAAEETPAPETEEQEELSELTLAETEILDGLDYSQENFLTEEVFYKTLMELLALRDLELTPYPGENAYYFCNYDNVENVKLLTVSKTWDEIEADRIQAQLDYEARLAGEETEEEKVQEEVVFDAAKDVTASQDYVVSFVMSASPAETDQQLLFLITSAAWAILNPKYDNIDDSFAYLWMALFNNYNYGGGLSASTIDGFNNEYSFTIPGNAAEAWIGTDENGNYIVAITLYAVYDEVIDIAGSTGTSFQSAIPEGGAIFG